MTFVRAGDVQLEYFESGSGEPTMVLVHGASSSARIWHSVQQELAAAGIRSYAMSMRGAGGSDHTPSVDDYNPDVYAADLAAALEALDLRSFVLMGHSLGVSTAVSFMQHRTSEFDVRGLVLMAGGSLEPRAALSREERAELEQSARSPSESEGVRRARWEPMHGGLPADVREQLWRDIQNNPPERTVGQRLKPRPDRRDFLGSLPLPTLVLTGDADATVAPEATLRGYLALSEEHRHLHVFLGVSHFPNAQIPDRLAGVLTRFVRAEVPTSVSA